MGAGGVGGAGEGVPWILTLPHLHSPPHPPQGSLHSPLDSTRSTRHHGLVERVQRDPRRMVSPLRRYVRQISCGPAGHPPIRTPIRPRTPPSVHPSAPPPPKTPLTPPTPCTPRCPPGGPGGRDDAQRLAARLFHLDGFKKSQVAAFLRKK